MLDGDEVEGTNCDVTPGSSGCVLCVSRLGFVIGDRGCDAGVSVVAAVSVVVWLNIVVVSSLGKDEDNCGYCIVVDDWDGGGWVGTVCSSVAWLDMVSWLDSVVAVSRVGKVLPLGSGPADVGGESMLGGVVSGLIDCVWVEDTYELASRPPVGLLCVSRVESMVGETVGDAGGCVDAGISIVVGLCAVVVVVVSWSGGDGDRDN